MPTDGQKQTTDQELLRERKLPVEEVLLGFIGVDDVQEELRFVRSDCPLELIVPVFLEEAFLFVVGLLVEHFGHPLDSRASEESLQEEEARTEVDPVEDDADDLRRAAPAELLLQFLLTQAYLHELFEDVVVEVVLEVGRQTIDSPRIAVVVGARNDDSADVVSDVSDLVLVGVAC